MKKIVNLLLMIFGCILAFIIIGVFVLFKVIEYRGNHYYKYLETKKALEKKYSELGDYEVSFNQMISMVVQFLCKYL